MTIKAPFMPTYGSGQTLTAAAASANAPISKLSKQIRLVNTGANPAYIRTYSSETATQVAAQGIATAADFLLAVGQVSTLTKDEGHDRIAYISAAGTTISCITGEGF